MVRIEPVAVAHVNLESVRNSDASESDLEFCAAGLVAKDFSEQLQRIDRRILDSRPSDRKGSGAVRVRDSQVEIDLEIPERIPRDESRQVGCLKRRPSM